MELHNRRLDGNSPPVRLLLGLELQEIWTWVQYPHRDWFNWLHSQIDRQHQGRWWPSWRRKGKSNGKKRRNADYPWALLEKSFKFGGSHQEEPGRFIINTGKGGTTGGGYQKKLTPVGVRGYVSTGKQELKKKPLWGLGSVIQPPARLKHLSRGLENQLYVQDPKGRQWPQWSRWNHYWESFQ